MKTFINGAKMVCANCSRTWSTPTGIDINLEMLIFNLGNKARHDGAL